MPVPSRGSLLPPVPNRWDRWGLTASGVCVVHCLVVPIVLASTPLWPLGVVLHEWFHPVLALVLVPTTVLAATTGLRKHGRAGVVVMLALGLLVVLAAGVLGYFSPGRPVETLLTLGGSSLLIAGHWRNWKADRCCSAASVCSTHESHDHAYEYPVSE